MKKLSAVALVFVLAFSTLLGGCSSSKDSASSATSASSQSEDASLDYIMDKGEYCHNKYNF